MLYSILLFINNKFSILNTCCRFLNILGTSVDALFTGRTHLASIFCKFYKVAEGLNSHESHIPDARGPVSRKGQTLASLNCTESRLAPCQALFSRDDIVRRKEASYPFFQTILIILRSRQLRQVVKKSSWDSAKYRLPQLLPRNEPNLPSRGALQSCMLL